MREALDDRLAKRLAGLRTDRGWSLDELAQRAGVSRSTLSRLERGEISPTTSLLARLCTAYGWTMSRLLADVEAAPQAVVRADEQVRWEDREAGFTRRSVSPPHAGLRAELIEVRLEPGADLRYDEPTVPGLEHHVWIFEGSLSLTANDITHELYAGDCLRFQLSGPTRYRNTAIVAVRYAVAMVNP